MAWCGTTLTNNNTAYQTRYSNCPYCLAPMAADIRVVHPEPERRRLERELAVTRKSFAWTEENNKNESHIAELREDVAKLERRLAAIKEVKTPEQAVEIAKKAAPEREAKLDAKRNSAMRPAAHKLEKTLAATTDAVSVPQQDCPIDEQITETTPNGYYAKLNRKPKGATQESQPWEIYLPIHGKSKFCARERSKQDAEARCWKLDRMAEEEKDSTTTINSAVTEAAAV